MYPEYYKIINPKYYYQFMFVFIALPILSGNVIIRATVITYFVSSASPVPEITSQKLRI